MWSAWMFSQPSLTFATMVGSAFCKLATICWGLWVRFPILIDLEASRKHGFGGNARPEK